RLARGTRFLRTPGTDEPRIAPRQGGEEAATPFQGANSRVVGVFQGYAKNAYPWLISEHRSAVRWRSLQFQLSVIDHVFQVEFFLCLNLTKPEDNLDFFVVGSDRLALGKRIDDVNSLRATLDIHVLGGDRRLLARAYRRLVHQDGRLNRTRHTCGQTADDDDVIVLILADRLRHLWRNCRWSRPDAASRTCLSQRQRAARGNVQSQQCVTGA